ncbi:glycosyltransferase family 10 [Planktomarina temperata]|nr:glycosyltransferase family 10 [Planktomarina temperata]
MRNALLIKAAYFDERSAFSSDDGDEKWNEFNRLLKLNLFKVGYDLLDRYDETDEYEVIICFRIDLNFGLIHYLTQRYPNSKFIYIASEEETVCPFHNRSFLQDLPFDIIYTWQLKEAYNGKLFKHYFYPHSSKITRLENSGKNFICTVTSLKSGYGVFMNREYRQRRNLIYEFDQLGGDIFGYGWPLKLKNYKGIALNKFHAIHNYTYTLILENSFNEHNAVSEKIFHAMRAGSIPVYLGAPNIDKILPKDSFVDLRSFESLSSCLNYLIANPDIITPYRLVISQFLSSTNYAVHTSEFWAEKIVGDIKESQLVANRDWCIWRLLLTASILTKGTFLFTKFFRSMICAILK